MNDPLIEMLSCVTDVRREQAKRYGLANILLFCIFGFLCGAKSYKALCSFIEERFAPLHAAFPSKMKRAPAPSTLWRIIGLVEGGSLEAVFRRHAAMHHAALGGGEGEVVAHDGKSLKGSYDTAHDQKMCQLFRAFAVGTKIILGHIAVMLKSNEIPAMQTLVHELGLAGVLCTADAMHCQLKTIEVVKATGGEALLQVKGNQPKPCSSLQGAGVVQSRVTRETGCAARADDATLMFFRWVRAWSGPLARRQGCLKETVRILPSWRWRDRSRSAIWPSSTG